jgi:hypothetical protein
MSELLGSYIHDRNLEPTTLILSGLPLLALRRIWWLALRVAHCANRHVNVQTESPRMLQILREL